MSVIDLQVLVGIVGASHVITGDDARQRSMCGGSHRPCEALAIVRPRTTAEVSLIMKACAAAGQAVVTHGGVTGLVGGAIAGPEEIVLSLERMTTITPPAAGERYLIAEAGAVLERVQNAADQAGFTFAVDFGARGSATIGGAVATNAGGNRVFRFGSMREQVLGLEVVLADGTIVDMMRGLVKDNAGYDLKPLFIGTEGTLGIVCKAALRLHPQMPGRATALLALAPTAELPTVLDHLERDLGPQLVAFEVMWNDFYRAVSGHGRRPPLGPDYPFYLLVECESTEQDACQHRLEEALMRAMERELIVDAMVARSEADRLRLWAMRDDVDAIFREGDHIDFDVSLPSRFMTAYADEVSSRIAEAVPGARSFSFAHFADNNFHLIVSTADRFTQSAAKAIKDIVYGPLCSLRGSISAEHGIGLFKRDHVHVSRTAEELVCMTTLKRAFDPNDLLNRGKVLPQNLGRSAELV